MALTGRTIAVTRPRGQDGTLIAAITTHGGIALSAPLIEIRPLKDLAKLKQCAEQLAQFAMVIFISANAVDYSLPTLLAQHSSWPSSVKTAAVGPGTAKALANHGILDCRLPASQFDSEHLLLHSELQRNAIADKSVLLIKGEGGRDLLAETLQARGARVHICPCYQRQAPINVAQPLQDAWQNKGVDGILLSSSEGLNHLVCALPTIDLGHLQKTPIFVPHPRIADNAMRAGLRHVILTPPADTGLIAGLLDYSWST